MRKSFSVYTPGDRVYRDNWDATFGPVTHNSCSTPPCREDGFGHLPAPTPSPSHDDAELADWALAIVETVHWNDTKEHQVRAVTHMLRSVLESADSSCTGTLVHDEFTRCPVHDK